MREHLLDRGARDVVERIAKPRIDGEYAVGEWQRIAVEILEEPDVAFHLLVVHAQYAPFDDEEVQSVRQAARFQQPDQAPRKTISEPAAIDRLDDALSRRRRLYQSGMWKRFWSVSRLRVRSRD